VLCQSFHNPALAARMGATLRLLSGGRIILGMGAGARRVDQADGERAVLARHVDATDVVR
jgi:alkanesulfonate monooxygenase SsuD/methylene tetrahydromethanopterin reductase-like flavin-dependent oxidoreductase (luciferase family)